MHLDKDKLRHMRKVRDLTIKEMAQITGYSFTHIQRMETGRSPISKRLEKLLEAWGWLTKKGP